MLADSKAGLYCCRRNAWSSTQHVVGTKGGTSQHGSICCKMFATEMVGRVADRAVQILGGSGYVAEFGIETILSGRQTLPASMKGRHEIQQVIIARNMIREAEGSC
ncbi:acyl-CoA dehydrogenase family protein [Cupriavidus basilensis]